VLELLVITFIIIIGFVGVAWYARKSSQQRTKLLQEINNIEPEMGDSEKFKALFEQEIEQQTVDNNHFEIDADPVITFSAEAEPQLLSEPKPEVKPEEKPQPLIDITDDDDDIRLSLNQQEPTPVQFDEPPIAEINNTVESAIIENEWDMVIAFTIMARENEVFTGRSIKATLESLDLHFGDLQLYHRNVPGLRKQTLFSVANIVDPGTLNPSDFATMTTPGLLVFSRLPGPLNGLTLLDELLILAQKMTDKLDGVLSDESREPVNQSTLEAMRSRILHMNMKLESENFKL